MARGQSEPHNDNPSSTNQKRPFASLEVQTKFVSEKRIRKQWRKVPEGVQARVLDVLQDVERSGLVQKKHRKPTRNANAKDDKEEGQTIERQQGIEEVVRVYVYAGDGLPFH